MKEEVHKWLDKILREATQAGVVCSCCHKHYVLGMAPHQNYPGAVTITELEKAKDLWKNGGRYYLTGGRQQGKSAFNQAMADYLKYGTGVVHVV